MDRFLKSNFLIIFFHSYPLMLYCIVGCYIEKRVSSLKLSFPYVFKFILLSTFFIQDFIAFLLSNLNNLFIEFAFIITLLCIKVK